mmetsp:Transcript_31050/g.71024  ORF Transcript_31050/g.71024 Transcript_31050/m.71024 type:complete len:265 (-) Transcript_31050:73-867(-)
MAPYPPSSYGQPPGSYGQPPGSYGQPPPGGSPYGSKPPPPTYGAQNYNSSATRYPQPGYNSNGPAVSAQQQMEDMARKCERYADLMINMDRALAAWENKRIDDREALRQCEPTMDQIQRLGVVDGDMARERLLYKGIDERRRVEMQVQYRRLIDSAQGAGGMYGQPGGQPGAYPPGTGSPPLGQQTPPPPGGYYGSKGPPPPTYGAPPTYGSQPPPTYGSRPPTYGPGYGAPGTMPPGQYPPGTMPPGTMPPGSAYGRKKHGCC